MQVHHSSTGEDGRPSAPKSCPGCGGCRKLHRCGSYERFRGPDGSDPVSVQRFACPECRLSVSVIPEGMLPYRCLPAARLEELLDERAGVAGGGARPPPASEAERGCARRAAKRLLGRIPFLRGCLGQMLPLFAEGDLDGFWRALRAIGRLGDILAQLARDHKSSLLACYRSLKPPWEREQAPV